MGALVKQANTSMGQYN